MSLFLCGIKFFKNHKTYFLHVAVTEAKKGRTKSKGKTCTRPCNRKLKPVCASDGKTYNNVCLFNNAKCEANKTGRVLKIEAQGPCRNETAKSIKEKAKCSAGLADCVQVGKLLKHAVCGSDNKTYPSFCFFRVARCQAKQNNANLTVLHKGECGNPKTKKPENCPVARQCDNREDPICASDKKTYRNTCLFVVAKCQAKEQNKKLTIKKRGKLRNQPVTILQKAKFENIYLVRLKAFSLLRNVFASCDNLVEVLIFFF